MDEVTIYCDGACSGNPGNAGWGAVLIHGDYHKEFSGFIGHATNNIAEVMAAVEALKLLKWPCKVTVISDSKYLVEGAKGAWNITTNLDVWEALGSVVNERQHQVSYQWVKGHSGDKWNERANVLANNRAYKGA